MYLGVDVGGTKVLVAVLDEHGIIKEQERFPTPGDYHDFLIKLKNTVASFTTQDFRAAGVGIPATSLDRTHGRGITFSNLPWRNVSVQADVEHLVNCPVVVENDAKLAGLSEAMLLKNDYSRILYVTISTGIGYALVVGGTIDPNVGDAGGRLLLTEFRGKLVPWESVASGHAIVKRYAKPAHDIEDAATWQAIARELAKGLVELIAITEPEVIVFGGSVGAYFDRYRDYVEAELKKFETPLVKNPVLRKAGRPEEAVVYGCYDLARAKYTPQKAAYHG